MIEHGREKEVEEGEEDGDTELHGYVCERTLASHSLLLSKAAGARMNEAMWPENNSSIWAFSK